MSARISAKAIPAIEFNQYRAIIQQLGCYTYIEQQLPSFQFPQTVPPCAAPQVPSVVTAPLALAEALAVGLERVGSSRGVVVRLEVGETPSVQPL